MRETLKQIFDSKSFYLAVLLAAGVFFLIFLNAGREYQAETRVLVIPRGELANAGQEISVNLVNLSATLVFFEKIFEDYPDFSEDSILELPRDKKRAYWKEKIEVKKIEGSGVLEVRVRDKSRAEAEKLSLATAKTLISTAAFFYEPQKTIDLRIVEEPVTEEVASQPFYQILLQGLMAGGLVSLLAYFLSFSLIKTRKEEKIFSFSFPSLYSERRLAPKEETAWPIARKPEIFSARTAAAPENLPIAFSEEKENEEVLEEKIDLDREPTEEEVKERLNRLLSGKF